ncbi:MAG: pyruvate dehydrogenase complex dihydrolipoamide acetyltransferase [Crocinitomicaceae bacterium]|nr:pyruvate dehydrogenase complex dihydrolipoamide acetyltransferase [Crocinitomicaceae bacterium]MBK9593673.1 pyruvate dehydrogenase complex dihydrolipoamide acetyltransferase [Crocinitomicaceae bacterium]
MAEIVRMPKLSDTMTEGVVAAWHKKVGDAVKEGELLAEIETDKATMEFESFYDGVLLHIGVEKGSAAPVNSVLAVIGKAGEDIKALLADAGGAALVAETKKPDPAPVKTEAPKVEVAVAAKVEPAVVAASHAAPSNGNGRIFVSPLARKMAEEKGINLATVSGSGENHRIVKKDIENYTPAASSGAKGSNVVYAAAVGVESYTDVPNSQMRKAIARTLSASKFSAPHFYLKMEVDMENAMAAREAINADGDVKISFNDMVVKAVAASLRRHPKVNADWIGDAIRYNNHIHVGVAVAVEDGLVVPVVKFTDTKGFAQLGAEIKDLAARAKTKKLQPQEMEGGTFAVSNLGMFGIEDFTSIINPPNGCILSVGQIKSTPVVKNGAIVPGHVMKLSLSCDHRVVDGAVGSAFLKTLKEILENPVKMLV